MKTPATRIIAALLIAVWMQAHASAADALPLTKHVKAEGSTATTQSTDAADKADKSEAVKEEVSPRNDPKRKKFLEGKLAFWFKDYNKAREIWLTLANDDYAEAQATLGWMYHEGIGVPQDYQQAYLWYEKAAQHGIVTAQSNLGIFYQNGYGVEQNNAKAAEWFTKAAEQGYQYASYNLALLYLEGKGVKKDREIAINLLFHAYRYGVNDARTLLESLGVNVTDEQINTHSPISPPKPAAGGSDQAMPASPKIGQ